MTKAKKGDVVALELKCVTYFINPYRHETHTEWQLVKVSSATRDGIVKRFTLPGCWDNRVDAYRGGLPKVHTIMDAEAQAAAQRIYAERGTDSLPWSSADELRDAIRAEMAQPRSVAA